MSHPFSYRVDGMAQTPVDEPTREYPGTRSPTTGLDGRPPRVARRRDARRDPPRIGGFARLLIFTGVVFALIVVACFGLRAINVLPSFDNPFADKTTDRSQPVLLQSMRDLSRYVAADGTFQVIVDLQENKDNIPDFLVNQRTLFVGSGTVEAYVDFGSLAEGAIKVDDDEQDRPDHPAARRSSRRRRSTWRRATSSPRSGACSTGSATPFKQRPQPAAAGLPAGPAADHRGGPEQRARPAGQGEHPARCWRASSPAWATPGDGHGRHP